MDTSLPTTKIPGSPEGSTKERHDRFEISRYLRREVSVEHADLLVIACCLVSGLCDSSAYNAWTCFVSMQTGNTIFLALGASNQPITHPYGWVKSFISIIFFFMGCFFFACTRYIGPRTRGVLAGSFFLQGACVFIAAALVQAGVVPEPHGNETGEGQVHFIELIPLAFLAFQSGGQIVTSRVLGFNEVPTTVLTSVYCDIASDPKLLASPRDNVKRNRRVAAVITLLVGGIAGGWISRSSAGMSTALWIAGVVKLGIAVCWCCWREKT